MKKNDETDTQEICFRTEPGCFGIRFGWQRRLRGLALKCEGGNAYACQLWDINCYSYEG